MTEKKTPIESGKVSQDISGGQSFAQKYKEFFKEITGFEPFPYQVEFAALDKEYVGLNVPTGLGKTLTTFVSFAYDRIHSPKSTPRKLIYVLPLRTLVDQTIDVAKDVIRNSGLSLKVYTMMGGAIEDDWVERPEEPAVIIGTLDQLLSRALLRPYTASVKSSLINFSAVCSDVRWVIDETQLATEAYPTTVALHELLLKQPDFHKKELILCSATLDNSLINISEFEYEVCSLSDADFKHPIAGAKVKNQKDLIVHSKLTDVEYAELIDENHKDGNLTLVIVNTVKRAQAIYRSLQTSQKLLVHSRFRRADRNALQAKLGTFRGVIVSTQVVEAGIDLSADCLITDVCPWSSLVQRAGRCARKPGTSGVVHVVDVPSALPYKTKDLVETANRLRGLANLNIRSILQIETTPNPNSKPDINLRLLKKLFDPISQEPISQYVRDISNPTVFVAYRYPRHLSRDMRMVDPLELVPIYPTQLLKMDLKNAWVIDDEATEKQRPRKTVWKKIDSSHKITPGNTYVIATTNKNYSKELGFVLGCRDRVSEVYDLTPKSGSKRRGYGNNEKNASLSLVAHLCDTANYAKALLKNIDLFYEEYKESVVLSSYLHDWGKASHVFQFSLVDFKQVTDIRDPTKPLAKGDEYRRFGNGQAYIRNGFRHEVPSALACLESGVDDLITFLVMSHHGQLVNHLRSMRDDVDTENSVCGVEEGDVLPAIRGQWRRDIPKPSQITPDPGYMTPEITFKNPWSYSKAYADLFDSCWEEHGPLVLAYLSTLVRISDHRASFYRESDNND